MPPQQNNPPLPPGHQLEEYRIERQLSLGGFSIVYLAYDPDGMPVAIKEYLPNTLALRQEGHIEPAIAPEHQAAFNHGMRCFFEEGRSLARLSHPNVVRVLSFFRANQTVYMVMRYERGRTLQEHVLKNHGKLRESFLRGVFARLINGLREVHAQKLLHLDIKPANIYLRLDGNPVLLDFGAARQALENDGPALRPTYTPGFAAPEQYRSGGQLGPWTDIYAVGASLYSCLSGNAPQASDLRLQDDKLIPASVRWRDQFSAGFLETIDACMKLDFQERPLSLFTLQKCLTEIQPNKPSGLLHALDQRLREIGKS